MILKYSVLRPLTDEDGNKGTYRAWNWCGELTRIQGFGLDRHPEPKWEHFFDCDLVDHDKPGEERVWQIYWLYRKDGKISYLAFPTYTEAYLLADDGSTVDRVN